MRTGWVLIAVVVLLVGNSTVGAVEVIDDVEEVRELYYRGKRLLGEGSYLEASRVFEELAGRFPTSPNLDLVIFNKAKADYYMGDYAKTVAGLSSFIARYPSSPLRPYALLFQANASYKAGHLIGAVRKYVAAYALSVDPQLDGMIEGAIEAAITSAKAVSLGPSEFDGPEDTRRCRLIRIAANALSRRQDFHLAERLLAECGEHVNRPGAGLRPNDRVAVGIVLPLSGDLQAYGEDIYHGATIAADMYREESGRAISLETFDTKGDPVDAGRIVGELAGSSFDAIVGPLTSEESAVASAAMSCGDVPLIAPAATQAGLTRLSASSFQLSPNVELQGVIMAEYAAGELQADSAAIIAPTSADEMRMARAFAERFKQLGGTIVAKEYYRTRDRDFGPYIRDLKALLIGAEKDSVYYINPDGDTIEADVVPAYIECLFLPGQARQLSQLIQQVHFYNLTAAYLGSDGWGDEAIYELGDRITKGAVFPSPFLRQRSSDEYARFAAAYDSRYGEQPGRLAALGYDALRLVAQAALGGAGGRADMLRALQDTRGYQGAGGAVTFGEHRENVALPVYRIETGRPLYLGTATVDALAGFVLQRPDMEPQPETAEQ